MNCLITGGAGFIGSNLSDKLLRLGYKVVCVDNLNDYYSPETKKRNIESSLSNKNFRFYKVDIEDKEKLRDIFKGIDIVIHLAARAGVRASFAEPEQYFNTNVIGTMNILELCRENKAKLIFGSSSSVYGENKIPFSDDSSAEEQLSPYGTTKRIAERLCEMYSKLYGLKVIVLRFFSVYGPRARPDLATYLFVKNILGGKKINMFGDGTSKRDYTYVDDVVDGIIAAIKNDLNFEIINIGDSNPVMLKDFISIIENITRKKAIIERLPEQRGDMKLTYADISKAKRLLGYKPKIPVEQGMKNFIEWYRKNAKE